MLKIDVTGLERWVGFDSVADIFSNFDNIDEFESTRARERNVQVKCTGIEDWSNEDRMPEFWIDLYNSDASDSF